MVNRIKAGDASAKEEFVLCISPHLRKIGSKLRISANELQSSADWVLTKVINNIHKLDDQKNILNYIVNSVRNFCIDEYRKVCVRKRKEGIYKTINLNRTTVLELDLDFLIEEVCKTQEEQVVIKKIVFEKENINDIAKNSKLSVRQISNLLSRVKEELVRD